MGIRVIRCNKNRHYFKLSGLIESKQICDCGLLSWEVKGMTYGEVRIN